MFNAGLQIIDPSVKHYNGLISMLQTGGDETFKSVAQGMATKYWESVYDKVPRLEEAYMAMHDRCKCDYNAKNFDNYAWDRDNVKVIHFWGDKTQRWKWFEPHFFDKITMAEC